MLSAFCLGSATIPVAVRCVPRRTSLSLVIRSTTQGLQRFPSCRPPRSHLAKGQGIQPRMARIKEEAKFPHPCHPWWHPWSKIFLFLFNGSTTAWLAISLKAMVYSGFPRPLVAIPASIRESSSSANAMAKNSFINSFNLFQLQIASKTLKRFKNRHRRKGSRS